MNKIITFDTNILIHDFNIIKDKQYDGFEKVILLPVIQELDNIKMSDTKSEEIKFRARKAIKELTTLLEKKEIKTFNTRIEKQVSDEFEITKIDDLIISMCHQENITLVTMDLNMSLKANAMKVKCNLIKDYKSSVSELYKGYVEVEVEDLVIEEMYLSKEIDKKYIKLDNYYPNMFVLAKSNIQPKKSFIAKFQDNKWILLDKERKFYKDFKPKNFQQKMLLDMLLDDKIDIITVTGSIGTGKTFETVGVALDLLNSGKYNQILLSKCINPLSKWLEIGFVKGEKDEKLLSYFNNYLSTLENLHPNRNFKTNNGTSLMQYHIDTKDIALLDLNSVIGSSFQDKLIIVDEAQGLDTDSMRSILTRIDTSTEKKSKLILMGDLKQNLQGMKFGMENGLYRAIESLKTSKYVGHITLESTTRGAVVEDVVKLFDNFTE